MRPSPDSASRRHNLPLVVQIGFAGSRILFDPAAHPRVKPAEFHSAAETALTDRLRRLPAELELNSKQHFLCGLSSLAIGADTLFARACEQLGWWQRFLLPQQREEFLAAVGSCGAPDFTDEQRTTAKGLFASPLAIEERVVSASPDRRTRFEDVNLELVRMSDVLVCLVRAGSTGKPGGTHDLIALAARNRIPLLEIRLGVNGIGQPTLDETWHRGPHPEPCPGLPDVFDGLPWNGAVPPDAAQYRDALKTFASRRAGKWQTFFKLGAMVIVGAHVLATAFALWAVRTDHSSPWLPWLLGIELACLGLGFFCHVVLHRWKAVRQWALARLAAEIARSVIPMAGVPRHLMHLFSLPMPESLNALRRTLNVLHLHDTRRLDPDTWKDRRNAYVKDRLRKPKRGQIDYYTKTSAAASRRLGVAKAMFYMGSFGALVFTATKLLVLWHVWRLAAESHDSMTAALGFLAVLLPVVAVAALSLAASFDLEARKHTYEEMSQFLEEQTVLLEGAVSENEFAMLALETEERLLGETAGWYARRAFTGVA